MVQNARCKTQAQNSNFCWVFCDKWDGPEMTLSKRGDYWYGDTTDDLRLEITRYSDQNGYKAKAFASSVCSCGSKIFRLESDENEGVAKRVCGTCGASHLMGDSTEHVEGAKLEDHICVCDGVKFELESAVALYDESNDVRWYYLGCRCPTCSLVGVFADWKCEGGDATAFLAKV